METAILRCAEDGRFLPSVPMLWTYQTVTFMNNPSQEWAGQPIQGDAEVMALSAPASTMAATSASPRSAEPVPTGAR